MKRHELNRLPVHPSANEFPMLDDKQFEALCEDIHDHGMVDAVVLAEDAEGNLSLLDGRNRLRAANSLELDEVPTTTWRGEDPTSFVISTNIHRRMLSAGQRAIMALRFKPHFEQRARQRIASSGKSDGGESGETRTLLGAKLGVNGTYITYAAALAQDDPEALQAVWDGKRSARDAYNELRRRQNDAVAKANQGAQTEEQRLGNAVTDKLDSAIDRLLDAKRLLKGSSPEIRKTFQSRFNKVADLIDSMSEGQ